MNSAAALKHAERPTWVDMATLSFHLCTSDRTIEIWIRQGKFPQPYQPGGGKRLWRWSEVEATMAASRNGAAPSESIPDEVIAAADRATRRRR